MIDAPAPSLEDRLTALAASYALDPLGFVMAAYPWSEPGELARHDGPRQWQRETLDDIGRRLRAGHEPGAVMMPVLQAIASGHGIGKSALLSWLVCWSLTTCPDARVIITANTEAQLRSRTWPEICRWFRMSLWGHWFRVLGTSIAVTDPAHERTWRCDAVTWSADNLVAFQGLHNAGRRLVLLFDEASGIDDGVWNVSEGALTDEDTEILWITAGNPTEPTGRFAECLGRQRDRWHARQIDARTVPGTNKALFAEWLELYGEDSDFFRVRVRGMLPRTGSQTFITPELVRQACERQVSAEVFDPLVIGCDVARFGSDQTVIYIRKGRDGRTHPPIKLRGADTMQVAARVVEEYQRLAADAVFVDGGGVGGGVVDRLRQLGVPVVEVQFGGKSDRVTFGDTRPAMANKRAEMWANMREWLEGGAIPDDAELRSELEAPQYSFVIRDGRDAILLERKEDMKRRGVASPDVADALALTFAYPVAPNLNAGGRGAVRRRGGMDYEYDPFAEHGAYRSA